MDVRRIVDFIETANCDIYVYTGEITSEGADKLVAKLVENPARRATCALCLTTPGGNPDAAYRMARALKRVYGGYTMYVFGYCKSAGTLIAVGADEIVMTDFGELGPLDIQMPKVDELDNESGLVYSQALAAIKAHAFEFFETCYLDIKIKSGGSISTKTASAIATGLTSPLAAQIDPLKIGESARALEITYAYGARLTHNQKALDKLINGYPSHGFVIDYEEAKALLGNVRQPHEAEYASIGQLKTELRCPNDKVCVALLDEILTHLPSAQDNRGGENDNAGQCPGDAGDPGAVPENHGGCQEEESAGDPRSQNGLNRGERAEGLHPEGTAGVATAVP